MSLRSGSPSECASTALELVSHFGGNLGEMQARSLGKPQEPSGLRKNGRSSVAPLDGSHGLSRHFGVVSQWNCSSAGCRSGAARGARASGEFLRSRCSSRVFLRFSSYSAGGSTVGNFSAATFRLAFFPQFHPRAKRDAVGGGERAPRRKRAVQHEHSTRSAIASATGSGDLHEGRRRLAAHLWGWAHPGHQRLAGRTRPVR